MVTALDRMVAPADGAIVAVAHGLEVHSGIEDPECRWRHQVVGRAIKQYTILEKLGAGGMGVVYKARDNRLGRLVAIKTLPPDRVADPPRRELFIHEAKAASALNHPNIVHIYDIDQADGIDFMSMEFISGKTLNSLIRRGGMPFVEALKYGIQIADALAAAHMAGIVHRDLKPGNVMVNEHETVKVLDFGLAKLTEAVPAEDRVTQTLARPVTEEGALVGTIAYMSPEQSEGKKVDARSDIFSFGSLLYEMLTGRRPFERDTTASTLAAILRDEPTPAKQIVENLPGEIDRVIKRCLRKDPAQRFQHMDDLKVALQELKQESDSGALRVPDHQPRIRRLPVFATATASVALLAAASGLWFIRSRPEPEPAPVPLTTYPGTEDYPSFSPDGTQVAFTWCKDTEREKCNVYIKQIGVEPPSNLTGLPAPEYSSVWSPDGRSIAFLRKIAGGRAALIIVPQRGGRERLLAEIDQDVSRDLLTGTFLAWTPDSKWIAVSVSVASKKTHALVLHSVETGERRKLTNPPEHGYGDINPAFSPVDQTLAFCRVTGGRRDIYLLRLDAGYSPQGAPELLELNPTMNASPTWMPAGREIVFLSGPPVTLGLWRANVARSGSSRMVPFVQSNLRSAAIAQRSKRLAYALEVNDSNIWRIDLRGRDLKLSPPSQFITSTRHDSQPAYSPDGKRVAFVSSRSGASELWVSDHNGSNQSQLTFLQAPLAAGPRWSWDSQSVAFSAVQGGAPESFVINASGGELRRLESLPSGSKWPYFSRNGKWVYFARDGQNAGVWKVALTGRQPIQITRRGDRPQESPDGNYVYYHTDWPNPMRIWRTGVNGGDETKVIESVHPFGQWTVTQNGIYFIRASNENGRSDLCFYQFDTRQTTTITTIAQRIDWLISVSPDGHSILYSQSDVLGGDLMLVENFQ